MAREIVCHGCGALIPIDESPSADTPGPIPRTTEIVIPATVSVSFADVAVGPWVSDGMAENPLADPPASADDLALEDRPAATSDSGVVVLDTGSVSLSTSAEVPGPAEPAPPAPFSFTTAPPSSSDAFPSVAFEPVDPVPAPARPAGPAEDQGAPATAGRSPAWVLLASYASAMTLACAYLLWHAPRRPTAAETLPADSRPDLGGPARGAFAPIPPDRVVGLGRPLTLGELEITPLEIRSGRVRIAAPGRREKSEPDALILRVHLRNLSEGRAFAPLEPAFVREPDRGLPDSFIERPDGSIIDIFPLAVESELAIVGQSFAPLGPGEERETIIVSDKQASARLLGEMTWRLRLRVASDQTEVVGVRFQADDVR